MEIPKRLLRRDRAESLPGNVNRWLSIDRLHREDVQRIAIQSERFEIFPVRIALQFWDVPRRVRRRHETVPAGEILAVPERFPSVGGDRRTNNGHRKQGQLQG